MVECVGLNPKNEISIKGLKLIGCVVRSFTCIFVGSNPTFPAKKICLFEKIYLSLLKQKKVLLKLPCGEIGRHDGRDSI